MLLKKIRNAGCFVFQRHKLKRGKSETCVECVGNNRNENNLKFHVN